MQNLGEIAHHRGDDDRALELLRQSLRLSVELEAPVSTAFCLEEIAAILTSRGKGRLAARLLGRGSAIRSEARSPLPDGYRAQLYDPTLAALHDILDERDFTTEWEAGAALPIEELVAQALGVETHLMAELKFWAPICGHQTHLNTVRREGGCLWGASAEKSVRDGGRTIHRSNPAHDRV